MPRRQLIVAALCLLGSACMTDDEIGCTAELIVHLSGTERTIVVGERFTPWVRLYGCGGRERLTDSFTWRAEDPRVVAVDAARGTVTGLAPGRTAVAVRGATYHELGAVLVTVRARAP